MNPSDLQIFNQAVATAQSGQTQAAHATLTSLNQQYPTDTNVLLWLAFTSSDWHTASTYIEKVAQFEPNKPSLAGAREWLASQKEVATLLPPQPVPYSAFETAGADLNNSTYSGPANYEAVNPNLAPSAALPSQSYGATEASNSSSDSHSTYNDGATKPKRPRVMIIAAVIAGLLIVGTVVIVLTGSTTNGVGDLPAPSNADSIDLGNVIQNALQGTQVQGAQAQAIKNLFSKAQIGYYAMHNTTSADVISTYSQQLKNSGWASLNNALGKNYSGLLTNSLFFTKGSKAALMGVLGPVTADNIATEPASLKDKLKSGDLVLILMEFDAKDVPGAGS